MNEHLSARLRALEGTGLIRLAAREPDAEYAFRHALSLDAAYESMLKLDRRRLHHDVGECLERVLTDNPEEFAPLLARHFDEAGDDARALRYLMRAAESAASRYANPEAIMLLERALAVALRSDTATGTLCEVAVRLGRLREMAGDYAAALATYDALEALAGERGDITMTCQAFLARAAVFCAPTSRFDAVRGRSEANEALRLAIAAGDRPGESKAHWLLLLVSKFNSDPAGALRSGEASASIARELGLREQLAFTLNDLSPVHLVTGRPDLAQQALEEAQQLWREVGNLPLLADTLTNLAESKMFAGKLGEAETTAREAIRVAEMTGNLWGQSYSRGVLSQTLIAVGRYNEAMAEAATSIELGKRAGFSISQIWTPCVIAESLCELGQPERGLAIAREAVRSAEQLLDSWRGFPLAVALICLSAMGDCAAAASAADDARGKASSLDLSNLMYGIASVEYARACGDLEAMLPVIDDGIAQLEGFGFVIYQPALLTRKSEGERMLGRAADAAISAERALDLAGQMGSHRGLWRTWAALAEALNAQGKHADAEEAVTRARDEIAVTASQAGSDALRASFLALPAVRTLLEDQ